MMPSGFGLAGQRADHGDYDADDPVSRTRCRGCLGDLRPFEQLHNQYGMHGRSGCAGSVRR